MSKDERFHVLFESMIDDMANIDNFDKEHFVHILVEMCELFSLSKGVTEYYINTIHEKNGDGEIFVDYDNGKGDVPVISKRIVTKSQSVIKGTLYMSKEDVPLSDEDYSKIELILRAIMSFVSRNRLQNEVEKLGFYDEVGYPNLHSFYRCIEQINNKSDICDHTAVHYNLRHFSVINQEIGRAGGDAVMKSHFDLIQETIGDNGIVCRVGGDNFVAIFKKDVSDNVLGILKDTKISCKYNQDKRISVSASVGVFEIPENYVLERPTDIMEKVNAASIIARQKTSGQIVYYDQKMIAMKEHAVKVQRRFPKALENREFKVFYQPKVNILNGEIVGAEALCRWFHNGKIVPPGEFIPVLEQNTDICLLDFYMLEIVCEDIRRWLDTGNRGIRISVNLSRKHFVDADLLEHIMHIVDSHNVPHNLIEIELTETTTDVEFLDLKRIAAGLQKEGIYTSVDDFGVGYSSLNLIREIPWNVLKIDRCFLPSDDDPANSVTSLMYKHVISMAQDIGLECITEGVETIKQVNILRENNCHIAQGYFFDRPLPVEEFEKRLEQRFYNIEGS